MLTSVDRILTTHVGSLPRPPKLRELMRAQRWGEPFDAAELASAVRSEVADVVRRQADGGSTW